MSKFKDIKGFNECLQKSEGMRDYGIQSYDELKNANVFVYFESSEAINFIVRNDFLKLFIAVNVYKKNGECKLEQVSINSAAIKFIRGAK